MIFRSTRCQDQPIAQFIANQLNDDEQTELEQHLSDCHTCQRTLEDQVAEPGVWNKAAEYLGDTPGEQNSPSSRANVCDDSPEPHPTIQSVLGALSPSDDPDMLGRMASYQISGVIGCGGMGVVLKGFDQALKRVVAIKIMSPHLSTSGAARKRFAREAQAAAAITHHNVIDIYAVSENQGQPFLVMPYARGMSLQKRIDQNGALPTSEVLRIGVQIASGLAAAHEQGLVHRDIKPANILLNDGVERLVITDFGLARAVDDASVTRTGVIAGTPQYMSPEQARGEPIDHRSDLFSLGSVLYTLCTGRVPFRAESALGILRRITDSQPRSIGEIHHQVPDWLIRIIIRLHQKSPENRYASASEVAQLLQKCLAHLQSPQTPLPEELQEPPFPPSSLAKASSLPKVILTGVAIIGGITLTVFFDSDANRRSPTDLPGANTTLPPSSSQVPIPQIPIGSSGEQATTEVATSLNQDERFIDDIYVRSRILAEETKRPFAR